MFSAPPGLIDCIPLIRHVYGAIGERTKRMAENEKETPKQGAPAAPKDGAANAAQAAKAQKKAEAAKKRFTRRQVVAGGVGIGAVAAIAGLVAGGVLAKWGVVEDSVENGRITLGVTPHKLIVTDRARCSGCQRCELMCTLRNDGRASHSSARVQVWRNYNFGHGNGSPDGTVGLTGSNCEFTVEHCKQCKNAWCVAVCPVHAIQADPKSGARVIDPNVCIGCGMCHDACPWNMPRLDQITGVSSKCIACGRCAQQCPNGAIRFVDWKDIAQECINQGLVTTTGLFTAEELQEGSDELAAKVDYSQEKDIVSTSAGKDTK